MYLALRTAGSRHQVFCRPAGKDDCARLLLSGDGEAATASRTITLLSQLDLNGAHVSPHGATQICASNKNTLVHLSRRDSKTLATRRRQATESEIETYSCFLFSLFSLSHTLTLSLLHLQSNYGTERRGPHAPGPSHLPVSHLDRVISFPARSNIAH